MSRKVTIGYLIVFLIIVGFLIYSIVGLGGTKVKNPVREPKAAGTSKVLEEPQASGEDSQAQTVAANSPAAQPETPAATPSNTSASTPSSSSSQTAKQLANTGPGETLALSLTVALVSSAAAYSYQRRRFSGNTTTS